MRNSDKGLWLAVGIILINLVWVSALVYIAIHFLRKFW